MDDPAELEATGSIKKAGWGSALTLAALAITVPLTASREGERLKTYLDPAGIPTICYGETLNVKPGETKTAAQCSAMLTARLGAFSMMVQSDVKVPMKPEMLAAFTDFAYNAGVENFQRSTMLKKLNSGDYVGACNELPKWNHADGKVLPGLTARRAAERALCLKGI